MNDLYERLKAEREELDDRIVAVINAFMSRGVEFYRGDVVVRIGDGSDKRVWSRVQRTLVDMEERGCLAGRVVLPREHKKGQWVRRYYREADSPEITAGQKS